jgi:hypothetical protein
MSPLSIVCLLLFSFWNTDAFAWGERGHDLVTRVAARIMAAKHGQEAAHPFQLKDHMLGHLSNIPDIYWRGIGKEISDVNGPTHYVDMEYLHPQPELKNLPRTILKVESNMGQFCQKKTKDYVCPEGAEKKPDASLAGTAPWRIKQLAELMSDSFKKIKPGNELSLKDGVDGALLYAGLLAHFVGDLSQPLHNSRDYDGWERNQGGLHAYFESQVVAEFPLNFDQEVLDAALKLKPATPIVATLNKEDRNNPLMLGFALGMDSFLKLKTLFDLDLKHSLLKKSTKKDGMKLYAKRKPPKEVLGSYKPLLVERLAAGADMLAHVWYVAWQNGGSPDLTSYKSYTYPINPAFIEPDYLTKKTAK